MKCIICNETMYTNVDLNNLSWSSCSKNDHFCSIGKDKTPTGEIIDFYTVSFHLKNKSDKTVTTSLQYFNKELNLWTNNSNGSVRTVLTSFIKFEDAPNFIKKYLSLSVFN